MASETKRCASCGPQFDPARCNRKPEFCDATPTPAADGDADLLERADALAHRHIHNAEHPESDPTLARAYLALRARPALPADVQAAVANLRMSVPDDNCLERCGEEWCSHALEVIRCEGYNQALDDLLAHLTREAR